MNGSIKTKLDVEAYERDGYCCVVCGKTSTLEAHHIIEKVEQLNNLITLCHSCHKKKHNMAGCFVKGFDSRRSERNQFQNGYNPRRKRGHDKGHPFLGNKYRFADGSLRNK